MPSDKSSAQPGAPSNATKKNTTSAGATGNEARARESQFSSAVKLETSGANTHSSPKKRRKVNHGKLLSRGMRQGSNLDVDWTFVLMAWFRFSSVCLLSTLGMSLSFPTVALFSATTAESWVACARVFTPA